MAAVVEKTLETNMDMAGELPEPLVQDPLLMVHKLKLEQAGDLDTVATQVLAMEVAAAAGMVEVGFIQMVVVMMIVLVEEVQDMFLLALQNLTTQLENY